MWARPLSNITLHGGAASFIWHKTFSRQCAAGAVTEDTERIKRWEGKENGAKSSHNLYVKQDVGCLI